MPYVKQRHKVVIYNTYNIIKEKIYAKIAPLEVECYKTKEPVPYAQRTTGEYSKLNINDKWGDLWDCAWFHFKGRVPESTKGKKAVLLLDISGEGCIVDDEGNPIRGITVVDDFFDSHHGLGGKKAVNIADPCEGNETIDFWMDAGCNCLFGSLKNNGIVALADIAVVDMQMRALFYDFQVLYNLMEHIDEKSARYNKILFALYQASIQFTDYNEAEVSKAREILAAELSKKGGDPSLKFTAIGHSHLDLAWLWPIRETIRKGARTFSTALDLMDQYPDYVFGASQPQLYEWMKIYYPGLYKRIKQKVKEGRWEVQGCMWVEADSNLIGGESMVRQILYGKRFFKDEFGVDVQNLWLPDVFGYSGALPQILKKSGCDYFMTQKLSWNEYNKFPHQSFMWQGIDGTEIFAHMLPEENYNGALTPEAILYAEQNYKDSGICDEALMLFGIGDGGGGPGMEHLERAMRLKNLNGLCPVEQAKAQPLFERLAKTKELKKWCGELYLEKHQGTYTTQAKNKRYNRLMEISLRELEFALVLSDRLNEYPKETIDKIWKEVLLYQFHDIIPGSSIKRVYDESIARYEVMLKTVNDMTDACYRTICKCAKAVVFNSLSWERNEIVKFNGQHYILSIPPMGYTSINVQAAEKFNVEAFENRLENKYLAIKFGEDGAVESIFDKLNGREVLKGKSNVYNLYEDINANCWDIGIEYTDRAPSAFKLTDQKLYVEGPDAVCQQSYTLGASSIQVKVILRHDSKRVDFRVQADWHENEKMLRTSFNTNIMTDSASFEIQFGKIDRKNNDNTSWENAQFEVCGHKWVDLSEGDYGAALLNDCKYGYRVVGSIIDMNLLRSQNYPGEDADRGHHEFAYSFYPHAGNEINGQVSKQAYEFNIPVHLLDGEGDEIVSQSMFQITDGAVIESVKKAEDSPDVIIRIFEPYGRSVNVTLQSNLSFGKAFETDLMENKRVQLDNLSGKIMFRLKPFEIKTILLKMQ